MSWRNARYYIGPDGPFDRGDDERSPTRCTQTKIIEQVIVRDVVPDEVIDQLETRMTDIAVDAILYDKKRRKKT